MKSFLNVLIILSLGIWIGSLVFFGVGVASIVFTPGLLPDRTIAGAVNSAILGRLVVLELICGILLLGGAIYMAVRSKRWLNWTVLALTVMMLGTSIYYSTTLF